MNGAMQSLDVLLLGREQTDQPVTWDPKPHGVAVITDYRHPEHAIALAEASHLVLGFGVAEPSSQKSLQKQRWMR